MSTSLQKRLQSLEPDRLSMGSHGPAVRSLQLVLVELQFYSGSADGYFGCETARALQHLQREYSLAETGDLNTATWYVLTFWALPTLRVPTQTNAPNFGHWLARMGKQLCG